MGTHGAFSVTKSSGEVCEYECTADGYCCYDFLVKWARNGFTEETMPSPEELGGGFLEIGKEREHQQEYFFHVDFQKRTIGVMHLELPVGGPQPGLLQTNLVWTGTLSFNPVVEFWAFLRALGWSIEYRRDTPGYEDPQAKKNREEYELQEQRTKQLCAVGCDPQHVLKVEVSQKNPCKRCGKITEHGSSAQGKTITKEEFDSWSARNKVFAILKDANFFTE